MAWRGLEMTLKGSVGKTQAKGATGRVPYNKAEGAVWYRMRREFGLEGAGAVRGGRSTSVLVLGVRFLDQVERAKSFMGREFSEITFPIHVTESLRKH